MTRKDNWQLFDSLKRNQDKSSETMKKQSWKYWLKIRLETVANNKYYQNIPKHWYTFFPSKTYWNLLILRFGYCWELASETSPVGPHPRPPRPFVHGLGAIGADRDLPLPQHLREPRLGTCKESIGRVFRSCPFQTEYIWYTCSIVLIPVAPYFWYNHLNIR